LRAQFSADDLIQFEVLLNTIELWDADRMGMADADSWTQTQDVLLTMGYIPDAIDTSAAFTNAFLPE
jgi:hypothetical protein